MEFCPHGTKVECTKVNSAEPCKKLHFKKIIQKHTDESLGDCSFLNTCFHMDTCKYVFALPRRNSHVRFEVFTVVTMKKGVFWDVTPSGSCKNRLFG
jgi:hypothetical protein